VALSNPQEWLQADTVRIDGGVSNGKKEEISAVMPCSYACLVHTYSAEFFGSRLLDLLLLLLLFSPKGGL
jgi:hypothetical protein